jgi:hypothetical protein
MQAHLVIDRIDEKDRTTLLFWLKPLKQQPKIGAIVTNDLRLYRALSE